MTRLYEVFFRRAPSGKHTPAILFCDFIGARDNSRASAANLFLPATLPAVLKLLYTITLLGKLLTAYAMCWRWRWILSGAYCGILSLGHGAFFCL